MEESLTTKSKEYAILSFTIGNLELAVNINEVEKILKEQTITPVPHSPPFVEGIIDDRNKIVPVVDLRKKLGIPFSPEEQTSYRILNVKIGTQTVGMIVDKVAKVIHLPKLDLEPIPEIVRDTKSADFLEGVLHYKDRLVFFLNLKKVLTTEEKELLKETIIEEKLKKPPEEKVETPQLHLIIFVLSSEWFAVNIEDTQEVVSYSQITPIPFTPNFVLGVINLRGNIVWVIDIKTFLGLERTKKTKEISEILIIKDQEKTCGLLVDEILQLLKIPQELLQPSLATLEGTKAEFVRGEIKITKKKEKEVREEKLITLLNTEKIMSLAKEVSLR